MTARKASVHTPVAQQCAAGIRRRAWLLATAGTTLWGGFAGQPLRAQPAQAAQRIAYLTAADATSNPADLQAFRDGLRERGHVEGRDVVLDMRFAQGRVQDLPRLAAELAALRPAVIVAPGPAATDAALAATAASATPVVSLGDLVAWGHAAQLARPDGRVTGISFLPFPLNAKRLELLALALPRGSAVLNLAELQALPEAMQRVEDAGRALGLVTHAAYARSAAEIDAAFAAARRLRVAGVNVLNSPFLHNLRAHIFQLAASAKLPAIYQWPDSAREGGLMAYGPSLAAMHRQLAGYASRILAGARVADLPIEQPTRFELVINLKTARALGLTIPQSLLLRADEVIQ
jgi:putative tryptophan/tyrosine transport system substrate-binding protein